MSNAIERVEDNDNTYNPGGGHPYVGSGFSAPAVTPTPVTGNGASALALAANAQRKWVRIQNTGTTTIFINQGLTASAAAGGFVWILAPGTATNDGYGGGFQFEGYTGPISVYSAGAFSCVISEE